MSKWDKELLSLDQAARIRRKMVEAISQYNMIEDGDRVLAAVSGGKDSSIMLALLEEIRKKAPIQFTLEAVILDQKQPGFNAEAFSDWVKQLGVNLKILEQDTYSIVVEKVPEDKTYCSLCSRLRRGILYNYAHEKGFTKLALGHHRDDLLETTLLNLFYSGKLASMPPKLKSDDGRNTLIRPLSFVPESELLQLSEQWKFPIIPCKLCGSQEGLKRGKMKQLIQTLEAENPQVGANFLHALQNVRPSQLLDSSLWNFESL